MCYGMNCVYENSYGECGKPGNLPCPSNSKEVDIYEDWEDRKLEDYLEKTSGDDSCFEDK